MDFTLRPNGEELCRVGPDGSLVSYSPALAPFVAAIRRAALEEAAKVAEATIEGNCYGEGDYSSFRGIDSAAAIRALAAKEPVL